MTADLLRRVVPNLRSPYLCNWDHAVAHALADLLESVAAEAEDAETGSDGADLSAFDGLHRNAVTTARALLRSFGHTCADSDEPCRSCAIRVPTPEDAP